MRREEEEKCETREQEFGERRGEKKVCERRAAGRMWITGSGRERGEGGKRNRKRSRVRQRGGQLQVQ